VSVSTPNQHDTALLCPLTPSLPLTRSNSDVFSGIGVPPPILQSVTFQTGCSDDLAFAVGDVYGSLTVVGFECEAQIPNTGMSMNMGMSMSMNMAMSMDMGMTMSKGEGMGGGMSMSDGGGMKM
jgi:hypothetical protein